jgi:hypothetical protein
MKRQGCVMLKNEINKAICNSRNFHSNDNPEKPAGVASKIALFVSRFSIWMPIAAVLIESLKVESLLGRRLNANQAFVYLLIRLAVFASVALALGIWAIRSLTVFHHLVPSLLGSDSQVGIISKILAVN